MCQRLLNIEPSGCEFRFITFNNVNVQNVTLIKSGVGFINIEVYKYKERILRRINVLVLHDLL